MTEAAKVKTGIPLNKSYFLNSGGLYPSVYAGKITEIASLFLSGSDTFSQGQILALISQKDFGGRSPIDIAW